MTYLAAVVLDLIVGEPPSLVHPVVWMGRVLTWLEERAPEREPARFVYGTVVAVGLPLGWGVLGWLVERLAPWPLQAIALKATFAGRGLLDAGQRVEEALRAQQVGEARRDLRWLVSRPTADLEAGLIASAAIESLAENFVDSWLAPLLAYAIFGLGGAFAYRATNTADAMWGYRTPMYEWLGKSTARVDDGLNWLPARLGALVLFIVGLRRRDALAIWHRDARLTASPNAGQVMSMAAGQLGVRLQKPGHYTLHPEAALPSVQDIAAARRLVGRAMLLAAALGYVLRRAVRG